MSFPHRVVPVFGSGRAYADLNFAGGSFGLDGRIVNDTTLLPGFTFTGASLRTMFDSTGAMTYGPNNQWTYSGDISNAAWGATSGGTGSAPTKTANYALAPDGTMTATRLQCNLGGGTTSAASSYVTQPLSSIAGNNAIESVWLKTNDGTSKTIYARAGNTETTFAVTGTWTRFSFVSTATTGSSSGFGLRGGQTPACSDTADLLSWGAQMEIVTYRTTPAAYMPTTSAAYYGPRLVYDPVTLASLGILVEEARTNVCLQSQDFATTWLATRASVTANATTSPDGTVNADALVEDGTAGNNHRVAQALSKAASAITYTQSVYAKKGSRNYIAVYNEQGANTIICYFDLNTGVISSGPTVAGTYTSGGASITALPNGWYRCTVTFTSSTGTNADPYIFLSADGTTINFNGVNGQVGAYLWQAQLEAGTGASSAIVTTSAAVTRAADDVVLTGLSVGDPCTILFEGRVPAFVSTDARSSLSTGSTVNRLWVKYDGTNFFIQEDVASTSQYSNSVPLSANAPFKAAISSNGGIYTGAINGTQSSGAAAAMVTLTQLDIGRNAGSALRYWNNTQARIRIWKSVQPVASLTA